MRATVSRQTHEQPSEHSPAASVAPSPVLLSRRPALNLFRFNGFNRAKASQPASSRSAAPPVVGGARMDESDRVAANKQQQQEQRRRSVNRDGAGNWRGPPPSRPGTESNLNGWPKLCFQRAPLPAGQSVARPWMQLDACLGLHVRLSTDNNNVARSLCRPSARARAAAPPAKAYFSGARVSPLEAD